MGKLSEVFSIKEAPETLLNKDEEVSLKGILEKAIREVEKKLSVEMGMYEKDLTTREIQRLVAMILQGK